MKSLMKFHDMIWNSMAARGIKKTYQWLLVLSGAAIVLAMLATVAMRYLFKTDLFGMEEVILTVAIWFYFMGGANGSMEDSQISADIVTVMIRSERIKWCLRIFTRIIEIVVLVFFVIMMTELLIKNFKRFPTTQGLKIPYVVPQIGMMVGFVLMFFYAVGHFIDDLSSKPKGASRQGDESE